VPRSRTPSWVDRLNALGPSVEGAGHLVALDADELLDVACRSTGLDDFGGGTWVEPYRTLLRALDEEARLTTLGRLMTRADLLRVLQNRLRLAPLFPAVAVEAVEQPVFVLGPARSGTSILFELLALDPRFRTPASWEVHHPVPPPEAATDDRDVRIALTDREVKLWNDVRPEYRTMHEEGGRLPKECIFITAHEFNSDYWTAIADVPSYNAARGTWDPVIPYRYHRAFLQVLQSRHRRDHWLLKAPSHLFQLRTLFTVYPDALIVHTHRDPHMTVPSTISLTRAFRLMRSDVAPGDLTLVGLGMGWLLTQVMDWRTNGDVPDDRFADVHFADLMARPVDTVRAVYERFGWTLTDDVAGAIDDYLERKPRAKHGEHAYALADFGIDTADVDSVFGRYVEHYGIARER
jgi:hypothetical protein